MQNLFKPTSTVCCELHSVAVPVISMALPVPVELVPKPPRITLGRDLNDYQSQ